MYSNIPIEHYLKFRDTYLSELNIVDVRYSERFQNPNVKNNYVLIAYHTLQLFLDDYALFMAFRERFINEGTDSFSTIHIGLMTAHNFTSFWDYLGYGINETMNLEKDEDKIGFSLAIDSLLSKPFNRNSKKYINSLKQLFEKEVTLRNNYRNVFSHRFHEIFFYRDSNDSHTKKVDELSNVLLVSYKRLLEALKCYSVILDSVEA